MCDARHAVSADEEDDKRRSFDAVARAYEAERPGYPDALFDRIATRATGRRALEIACGTGKATRGLLDRGFEVTAVELGPSLAAVAREALAGEALTVHVGRFEDWDAPTAAFDVALCAQAYHWIDPEQAGPKIARAVGPGGWFACLWNTVVGPVDWHTALYVEHAPELAYGERFPSVEERLDEQRARVEAGGALAVVEQHRHEWVMRRGADAYVRLIDTYSDHRLLDDGVKARLYPALRAAIEARGGVFEREMVGCLLLARPAIDVDG